MTLKELGSDALGILLIPAYLPIYIYKRQTDPSYNPFRACKPEASKPRNPAFEKASREYKKRPGTNFCWWCGSKRWIQPHHSRPFALFPQDEMDESLWVPLCEHGKLRILLSEVKNWAGLKPDCHCHLEHGHHGNWKSYNPDIIKECKDRKPLDQYRHHHRLRRSKVAPGDKKLCCAKMKTSIAPAQASILDKTPSAYDQGSLGYCFAWSLLGSFETEYIRLAGHYLLGSALFIGNMTKIMEGTFGVDNGATLSDGISAMKKYGVCHDSEFPYLIERFNVVPSDPVKLSALNHQLVSSYSIEPGDIESIEMAIANGYSVSFGMKLFKEFESDEVAKSGIVPTPRWWQYFSNIGGHAMRIVGYDRVRRVFIVMNSWDITWGKSGTCEISYDYIGNKSLAWDFVVITKDELEGEVV